VRKSKAVIDDYAAKFVTRLQEEAESHRVIDVPNLAEAFATGVTTACLFGDGYGAIEETGASFSAVGYFDSFVSAVCFLYTLTATWAVLDWMSGILFPNQQTVHSLVAVDAYLERLVKSCIPTLTCSLSRSNSFRRDGRIRHRRCAGLGSLWHGRASCIGRQLSNAVILEVMKAIVESDCERLTCCQETHCIRSASLTRHWLPRLNR